MKKLLATVALAAAVALPAAPAHAGDSARAGVSKCTGGGYYGVYVWYYDLDHQYEELVWLCIYTGP
ncbi:MAG: hypothetical protein M3273_00020 [Actinomycetota bacterium]|nr:hypothetical protein [Actinomycetota bacterium]